jgi:hypothetical protein
LSAPAKLAAFTGLLALLFAGGTLAGGAIDPERDDPADHAAKETGARHADRTGVAGGHGEEANAPRPVRGLAVADGGLRLLVEDPALRRGRGEELRFRIVRRSGETVRDFDVGHTKRMHVIVARRDLTGFQHLHPQQRRDGSWSLPITLGEAGSYRLFADFSHEDEPITLATDLRVDGPADLRALPRPSLTAVSDRGYEVRLDPGHARPGGESELRFTVLADGERVRTEPYLGAGGHLVALREGDLALLHVHPSEPGQGEQGSSSSVGFTTSFPSAGRYRLFLQFKHEGTVHTAAFTRKVS